MTPEYQRAWRAKNIERARAQNNARLRADRAANPDKYRAYERRHGWRDYLRRTPKKYGITPEQYFRMLDNQGMRCAICRERVTILREYERLGTRAHIDHCHSSKTVRGVLCGRCNIAIGFFQDDPARLRAASAYLESRSAAGG